MKIHLLIALLIAPAAAAFAQDADSSPSPAATSGTTPWSVVGKWNGKESILGNWADVVTISADGTFSVAWGDTGKWSLTTMNDHFALILAWENWPPEIVTLINADTFIGKTLELHRVVDEPAESGTAATSGTAAASGTGSSFFGTAAPAK